VSITDRQQEEKEQRRQSIIDAAEQVLQKKSLEAMTMSDIATTARLSRSLLYVYFEDMADIYLAVTYRGLQALREAFEAAAARHDQGLWKIRAIGEEYVRFAQAEPVYFDAVARFEARAVDPDQTGSYEALCVAEADRLMHVKTDAIQQGIDDGSIRPNLDPVQTAVTLWGYTHGLIQLAEHKGGQLERRYGMDHDALIQHGLDLAGVALTGHCDVTAPAPPADLLSSTE
jgi:AcrR family transcriptional regulator